MKPNIFSLYVCLRLTSLSPPPKRHHQPHHHGLHFAAISQPNRLDILPHCAASSLTTRVRMYAHLYRSCTSQLRPEAFVSQPIAHMNCVHHHPDLSAQRQPIYEQAVSVALCTRRDCFVIWGNEIWIADDVPFLRVPNWHQDPQFMPWQHGPTAAEGHTTRPPCSRRYIYYTFWSSCNCQIVMDLQMNCTQ